MSTSPRSICEIFAASDFGPSPANAGPKLPGISPKRRPERTAAEGELFDDPGQAMCAMTPPPTAAMTAIKKPSATRRLPRGPADPSGVLEVVGSGVAIDQLKLWLLVVADTTTVKRTDLRPYSTRAMAQLTSRTDTGVPF